MSSSPVVADTSVLITLAGVTQLELLARLYNTILIPRQVLAEYNDGASDTEPDLITLKWLTIVDGVEFDASLPGGLGQGEHTVISLAIAAGARLVLTDEIERDNAGIRLNRK